MPLNEERAYELMQSRGVDTLIASSTENVYYISDYWSLGKQLGCGVQAYAILSLKADPAIISPLGEADLLVDSGTWIRDLRSHGISKVEIGKPDEPDEQTEKIIEIYRSAQPVEDGLSALIGVLDDKGLASGVIALDTSDLTPGMYDIIVQKLPDSKIIEGSELLREIRSVKTVPEVEFIRRATEVTEKSMEDALEIVRPEIMELDLAGMFAYSVAYDGGQVTQNLIGFRKRSAFPNPMPSSLEAARGDIIRMTLGCIWRHYHSNVSRTAVIGRASAKLKKTWRAVQDAQDSAISAVVPGAKVSDLYQAAEKELRAAGIKSPAALGHNIGVECNEKPWITKDNNRELMEGMIINIDIHHLEINWGGSQIEDTILVTGDGYELLTKTDRELYLL